jgi:ornithine--oxo-acid transaminase
MSLALARAVLRARPRASAAVRRVRPAAAAALARAAPARAIGSAAEALERVAEEAPRRRIGSDAMCGVIAREGVRCAANYRPLPVVLERGEGVYLWDSEGRKLLDMMSAYSAVSHGHSHSRLVKVLTEQAGKLSIVSRAFHTALLGPFLERACGLLGMDMALPMNTGSEAVETAMKAARKWAYTVKGVEEGKAEIISCNGNFHGRTIAIVAMSTDPQYRRGFGPFPGGLRTVPYGDAAAFERAITENTAALIVEPIQGEGGIVIPPVGYLKECEEICRRRNVMLIVDEVQTGLGRTGKMLACEHDGVRPDGVVIGKALGGGILPISMFLAKKEIMDVFTPGDHGSTFGGNPLAAAVGLEALNVMVEDGYVERSAELGAYFLEQLRGVASPFVKELRGRGLFIGVDIDPELATAREVVLRLMDRGLLSKETHETVVRLAPPLIISREQLDWAVEQIRTVLGEMKVDLLAPDGTRRR